MTLSQSLLDLDWADVKQKIERFIRDYVKKSRVNGIVLGLSGGIDSCTVSALSSLAIGGDKVLGLLLPEQETRNDEDSQHARAVAKKFGFKTQTIDITPTLEALYNSIPVFDNASRLSKGNLKARIRSVYLYYFANRLHRLVCGSSDKSETMIGYFTKWGDVSADISPIMDLYKTQVRMLAQHMGLPEGIVTKPSSPRLWPGQVAEEELEVKYETLDLILFGLERFMKTKEVAEQLDIKKELVEKVKHKWLSMEHKRRIPITTKISYRTVGFDFRLPHTSLNGDRM